jgi:uncharacterized membrane protein YgcG
MGYYILVALVIVFICFIIGVAIRWEFEFSRWYRPMLKTGKRHNKTTTATSATDVTSLPPGFSDVATHDATTYMAHPPAAHGFDSRDDFNHSETGGFDNNSTDSTDHESGNNDSEGSDSSSYDSGGYDSGGSYS